MERGKFCVLRTSKLHFLRMVAHAGECLAKQCPGLSAFPLHSRCRLRWGSGGGGGGGGKGGFAWYVRLRLWFCTRSCRSPSLIYYSSLNGLSCKLDPVHYRELQILNLPKGFEINHLLCEMTCCKKGTRTFSSDLTVPP